MTQPQMINFIENLVTQIDQYVNANYQTVLIILGAIIAVYAVTVFVSIVEGFKGHSR